MNREFYIGLFFMRILFSTSKRFLSTKCTMIYTTNTMAFFVYRVIYSHPGESNAGIKVMAEARIFYQR